MKNKIKWLVAMGVLMVISGLVLQCISLVKENKNLETLIIEKTDAMEKLKIELDMVNDEKIRLQWQNDELWELYYSQVSDYNGEYEYYE